MVSPSCRASTGFCSQVTLATALHRSRHGFPFSERIAAVVSLPFSHCIPTSKPPLARSPLTLPVVHSGGSAGSRFSSSAWLCSKHSAIAANPPKFPSIWNGGGEFNKIRLVDQINSCCKIFYCLLPSRNPGHLFKIHARHHPVGFRLS